MNTPTDCPTVVLNDLWDAHVRPLNAETLLGSKPLHIDLVTVRDPQFTKTPVGWMCIDANQYDGPGSPVGWGETKDEALADLGSQLRCEE